MDINSIGEAAKITSKWQITIPKDVRERAGLSIGDRVAFFVQGNKIIMVTSFAAALEVVQDAFKGLAEEAGIHSDEDVQKLVDEVRHGK